MNLQSPTRGASDTDFVGAPAPDRSKLSHAMFILGKRRSFLVDKRTQLRAGVLATLVALVLIVLLNVSLQSSRTAATEAVLREAPELRLVLQSQNRTEMLLVLAASVVFLGGVFVVTILETHKTAGAAINIRRHLDNIRDGRYACRLRLRKGDNLGNVERSFNEMAETLQKRESAMMQEMHFFADQAEKLQGPEQATELAERLRRHAELHRTTAESR